MKSLAVTLTALSVLTLAVIAPANATSIVVTADLSGPSTNLGTFSSGSGGAVNSAGAEHSNAFGAEGLGSFPQGDWPDLHNAPIIIPPAFAGIPTNGASSETGKKDSDGDGDNSDTDTDDVTAPLSPAALIAQGNGLLAGPNQIVDDPQNQPIFSTEVSAETALIAPPPVVVAAAVVAIPEPASYLLFGAGFALLIGFQARRRQKDARAAQG